MYALMNPDLTLNRVTSAESFEWNGIFWGSASLVEPALRRANLIYDFHPAPPVGQWYTVVATEYVVDTTAGMVTETNTLAVWQLIEIQSELIAQTKVTAASLLRPTDWKVIRAAEGVQPCDQSTLDYRAAVRAAGNAYEAAVIATESVADLAALPPLAWPQ